MGSRAEWIFVTVLLLAQLVFLASQIQDPERDETLLDSAIAGATTPLSAGVDAMVSAGEDAVLGVRDRGRLRRENERLRGAVRDLQRRVATQQGALLELQRLQESLDYTPPPGRDSLRAKVVYVNHRALLRRMAIEVYEPAALDSEQLIAAIRAAAVVTEAGLVGRVVAASGRYAKVQLVTDRSSSVGVMIERTRRQGLLRGAGDELLLDYLPLQADVRVGDRVVTAGIDGVYPRGVTVGTVTAVTSGDELFHRVEVASAVDFGVLDQVFLLPSEAPPEEFLSGDVETLLSDGGARAGGDRQDSASESAEGRR